VESPTGTGKSLTLLTSTLTWLKADQQRLKDHSRAEFEKKLVEAGTDGERNIDRKYHIHLILFLFTDPPWVIAHTLKTHLEELESKQAEINTRLAKAREKELQRKRESKLIKFGGRNKRPRLSGPEHATDGGTRGISSKSKKDRSEDDDDQFLPLDTGVSTSGGTDQDDNISSEVKALLRQ
jgi:chromosome transmission fidelity protein 1